MKWPVSLLIAFCPIIALACPPPPSPPPKEAGEGDQAYQMRMQKRDDDARARFRQQTALRQALLWDFSSVILIARIERVKPVRLSFGHQGQSVRLKPTRWIKGEGKRLTFWLRYAGETDCGPYGGGDAIEGKIGEEFVVFARAGNLSSVSVEDSVGANNAIDIRIFEALSSETAGQ
jgi:hypothetical protein